MICRVTAFDMKTLGVCKHGALVFILCLFQTPMTKTKNLVGDQGITFDNAVGTKNIYAQ